MYEYNGKVLKVLDGDTAHVMLDVGFNVHVEVDLRFKGINAPEIHSTNKDEKAAAEISQRFLEALLSSTPLVVKTEKTSRNDAADKQEKYGRYLATVINSRGLDVAAEMIRAGHAVAYDGVGPRPTWPWKKT